MRRRHIRSSACRYCSNRPTEHQYEPPKHLRKTQKRRYCLCEKNCLRTSHYNTAPLKCGCKRPRIYQAIKGDLFILVFPFFVTAVLLIAVAIEIIIISNQVRNYFSAALNEDFTDGDLMLMKQSNRYKRAAYGTFYRADPACPIKKPI